MSKGLPRLVSNISLLERFCEQLLFMVRFQNDKNRVMRRRYLVMEAHKLVRQHCRLVKKQKCKERTNAPVQTTLV